MSDSVSPAQSSSGPQNSVPPVSSGNSTTFSDADLVRRAPRDAIAIFVVFVASGLLFATWVSRIPAVRASLHVDPGSLGLVLLSISGGAVLALPTAGLIVGHLGARRTLFVTPVLSATGLFIAGLASGGPIPLLAVGLALMGLGYGVWDVAMNVIGAGVERSLGRSLMPRLHAGYSLGTVIGAVLGTGIQALGISPRIHLCVLAVALVVGTPAVVATLPHDQARAAGAAQTKGHAGQAWRERRTLLIGLFMLTLAFAEGTGNDWLAVATVDGHHRSTTVGTAVFGFFVAAMTVGRLSGVKLLDRFGRVPVLRASCGIALVGIALTVLGPSLVFAFGGAVCWGLGAALGFPVGVSAAADDPEREAARVGVVATIAYSAFLAGPPLVGFLGDHLGVQHALFVVGVAALLGFLLAGSTRPLAAVFDAPARSEEQLADPVGT